MRFVLSYILFYIGDLFSKVLELHDNSERWVSIWYPAYNWFMSASNDVQGDGEGPWEHK
jgi:hypothetical protein